MVALKISRRSILRFPNDPTFQKVLGKSLLRDGLIVNSDTLTDESEMWGCVESNFPKARSELIGRRHILSKD